MAGRKPKPSALKLIQGNPGRRPINENEPQPEKPKRIRAPKHLPTQARREYVRVAKILRPIGLLTEADTRALELYATDFAIWLEALERMQGRDGEWTGDGLTQVGHTGFESPSALLTIAAAASKRMQSLLSDFGMTPSSRSRVGASSAAKTKNRYADLAK